MNEQVSALKPPAEVFCGVAGLTELDLCPPASANAAPAPPAIATPAMIHFVLLLIPAVAGAGGVPPGPGGTAAASFTDDNFPCAEICTICPDCINSPLLPSPVGTRISLPPTHVTVNDPSASRSIFALDSSPSVAPTTV